MKIFLVPGNEVVLLPCDSVGPGGSSDRILMDVPDMEIKRGLNRSEWAFRRAQMAVEEAGSMWDVE